MVEARLDRQQRGVVVLLVAVFRVDLSVSMRAARATVPIDRVAMSVLRRFAVRTGPIYRRVVFLVVRGHIALDRIICPYDLGAITITYLPTSPLARLPPGWPSFCRLTFTLCHTGLVAV